MVVKMEPVLNMLVLELLGDNLIVVQGFHCSAQEQNALVQI